ncbi:dTDP-4-dehydrorhamnose reductase [Paenibacillus swuensis]|uniref:dTDP-4-dehydrorhamnose reductase n=1 Tax=Paenibacillus swuensis TaxID=1178515 RepID=A0A172TGT6_9BACL|nr:SDR family oxidoreductase [Paenibacillus swuensis]ANE46087.1 dTDP-4-dehydrorhamnose reductase [Paenibacillus swuensis]
MKLLILGGNGMAGHLLVDYFRKHTDHEVYFTSRDRRLPGGLLLDVREPAQVEAVVRAVSPDVIINAVGILNESARLHEVDAYKVNAMLPHQLATVADTLGARVIHISTDCVFSGAKGDYTESDFTDGDSVYAKSKALGELKGSPHMTLRTSIIGPETRGNGIGLLDWFLKQSGTVKGYTGVLWNGITTLELAKAVRHFVKHPIDGLVQLTAPEKVSKHDLLILFRDIWNKEDVRIIPDGEMVLDRTLRSTRTDLNYNVPEYEVMLRELYEWMNG